MQCLAFVIHSLDNVLPIGGCSKTAECEFAVLTAVQLRMSESLNVGPCSVMSASVVSKD